MGPGPARLLPQKVRHGILWPYRRQLCAGLAYGFDVNPGAQKSRALFLLRQHKRQHTSHGLIIAAT
jgi:hypothetical protein